LAACDTGAWTKRCIHNWHRFRHKRAPVSTPRAITRLKSRAHPTRVWSDCFKNRRQCLTYLTDRYRISGIHRSFAISSINPIRRDQNHVTQYTVMPPVRRRVLFPLRKRASYRVRRIRGIARADGCVHLASGVTSLPCFVNTQRVVSRADSNDRCRSVRRVFHATTIHVKRNSMRPRVRKIPRRRSAACTALRNGHST